ncbi:MAG: hypothetical protein ACI92G_003729 [Candidatus Pelagisphaera sp.]|jgi:hypothetical protein
MKVEPKNESSEKGTGESCSIGGCGGKGMCPGNALMIGLLLGTGLSSMTGIQWLMPVSMIVVGGVLISGIWRTVLKKQSS